MLIPGPISLTIPPCDCLWEYASVLMCPLYYYTCTPPPVAMLPTSCPDTPRTQLAMVRWGNVTTASQCLAVVFIQGLRRLSENRS